MADPNVNPGTAPDLMRALGGGESPSAESMIRAITSAQPTPFYSSPWQQIGSAMAGYGAGVAGRPNPVIDQIQARHDAELKRQLTGIDLQLKLEEIQGKAQERRNVRDTALLGYLGETLKSDDKLAREWAAGQLNPVLQRVHGVTIPPAVLSAKINRRLSDATEKELYRDIAAGWPEESLKEKYGISGPLLNEYVTVTPSDPIRKFLGLPTKEADRLSGLQSRKAELDIIESTTKLSDPKIQEGVRTQFFALYNRAPTAADADQIGQAARTFLLHQERLAELTAGLQSLPPEQARKVAEHEQSYVRLQEAYRAINTPAVWKIIAPFIGPITTGGGIARGLARYGPLSITKELPREVVDLQSMIGTAKNIYANARSGGAIPPEEYARLLDELPDITADKPEAFRRKFELMMQNIGVVNSRMRVYAAPGGKGQLLSPEQRVQNRLDHPLQRPLKRALKPGEQWITSETGGIAVLPSGIRVPSGWKLLESAGGP